MNKSIISILAVVMIVLPMISGCATNSGPEYDGNSYKQIKNFEIGIVIAERPVVVKDDGLGTFLGSITGMVLGSFVGGGRASSLGTLGGALAGGYAGSEVGKANAQELTVELDYGEVIVIVVKGENLYKSGDRVKIIKDENKVADVQRLQ